VRLPVAARGVRRTSPPLSAQLLRVIRALILLGVLIAVSPTPPTIVGVLFGTIDSTEIGSRRDTKRCVSGNVRGLPLLTVPQAAVVDRK
jgi:hypothetical protein